MSDTVSEMQHFEQELQELQQRHQQKVERIQKDGRLSPQGKAEEIQKIEGQYKATVSLVHGEGKQAIEMERTRLQKALKDTRRQQAEQQRELLGDQASWSLLASEVSMMQPREMIEAVREAPSDWHRAALLRLSQIELKKRAQKEGEDPAAYLAPEFFELEKISQPPGQAKIQGELASLQSFERSLDRYSPEYLESLRQRFDF